VAAMHIKSHPMTHYMVLSPGEFNSTIGSLVRKFCSNKCNSFSWSCKVI